MILATPATAHRRQGRSIRANDGRHLRAEETRMKIRRAAREIIDSGTKPLTVVDVAKRAGVSVRSVFHHFYGIEGLISDLSAIRLTECARDLAERSESGDGPFKERVDEMLETLDRIYGVDEPHVLLLFSLKQRFPRAAASSPREEQLHQAAESARVRFQEALDTFIGAFLDAEFKQLESQGRAQQVKILRTLIRAQLHPGTFTWFVTSLMEQALPGMAFPAIVNMVIGTVREHLQPTSPR